MEQKVNNNMLQEDEIDLRELFKKLWKGKLFIIVFTLVVTIFAGVYAFLKTPIYEVKAIIKVGYIGDDNIVNTKLLVDELKSVFNIGSKNNTLENYKSIISSLKTLRDNDSLFSISSQSTSNKLAIEKINEVLNYTKDNYNLKISEFKMKVNADISRYENEITNINKIEKEKIERDIQKIKTQEIPYIQRQIDVLKNEELKSIKNKIKFNSFKLNEYEKNIGKLTSKKKLNSTENILISIQLQSIQSLILKTQEKIENLKLEENRIVDIKIKNLENKKKNLLNDKIKDLNIKLNEILLKKVNDLKEKISFEKFKLKNGYYSNAKIVGDIIINDEPIKPKKVLILVVAFVSGFILSIFLVFFLDFIKSFKEEK
ncbi:hypothetical protein CPU12_11580 [Malaciobacter molluscorum LMG 25693]|uniref:Chain length determinant protein, Wzz family n=1 Tax=Malaciobacter molluscorum LMG 25693 TaxID=870501 RepID=A0A2G1DFH1_9BACT|nr:Wzz/FepE/Etk N-terminal domain-containing protein [Malaciobacter molluscorum]AXX91769.1 putative chain length determinant protein, Wzz family [Malaciobacter molluscorum LMG 25693]PHO17235.1 hypothetical protein CPU12_11580 [Malaciobacter molluscorum LMG 25693]